MVLRVDVVRCGLGGCFKRQASSSLIRNQVSTRYPLDKMGLLGGAPGQANMQTGNILGGSGNRVLLFFWNWDVFKENQARAESSPPPSLNSSTPRPVQCAHTHCTWISEKNGKTGGIPVSTPSF